MAPRGRDAYEAQNYFRRCLDVAPRDAAEALEMQMRVLAEQPNLQVLNSSRLRKRNKKRENKRMTSREEKNSEGASQIQIEMTELTPYSQTDSGQVPTPTAENAAAGSGRAKPQFTVKSKEGGYVGSGWMRDGQYGKYLAVTLSQDLPKGTRLYVSPTRAAAGILG